MEECTNGVPVVDRVDQDPEGNNQSNHSKQPRFHPSNRRYHSSSHRGYDHQGMNGHQHVMYGSRGGHPDRNGFHLNNHHQRRMPNGRQTHHGSPSAGVRRPYVNRPSLPENQRDHHSDDWDTSRRHRGTHSDHRRHQDNRGRKTSNTDETSDIRTHDQPDENKLPVVESIKPNGSVADADVVQDNGVNQREPIDDRRHHHQQLKSAPHIKQEKKKIGVMEGVTDCRYLIMKHGKHVHQGNLGLRPKVKKDDVEKRNDTYIKTGDDEMISKPPVVNHTGEQSHEPQVEKRRQSNHNRHVDYGDVKGTADDKTSHTSHWLKDRQRGEHHNDRNNRSHTNSTTGQQDDRQRHHQMRRRERDNQVSRDKQVSRDETKGSRDDSTKNHYSRRSKDNRSGMTDGQKDNNRLKKPEAKGQEVTGSGASASVSLSKTKAEPEVKPECPLCLDPLDSFESSLYPCSTCKFQLCLFCLNRLREESLMVMVTGGSDTGVSGTTRGNQTKGGGTNDKSVGKVFMISCPNCRSDIKISTDGDDDLFHNQQSNHLATANCNNTTGGSNDAHTSGSSGGGRHQKKSTSQSMASNNHNVTSAASNDNRYQHHDSSDASIITKRNKFEFPKVVVQRTTTAPVTKDTNMRHPGVKKMTGGSHATIASGVTKPDVTRPDVTKTNDNNTPAASGSDLKLITRDEIVDSPEVNPWKELTDNRKNDWTLETSGHAKDTSGVKNIDMTEGDVTNGSTGDEMSQKSDGHVAKSGDPRSSLVNMLQLMGIKSVQFNNRNSTNGCNEL